MEHSQTIAGLQRKRKELAQEIALRQAELSELTGDLAAIEHALAVFGVSERPAMPPPVSRPFARSELRRPVLNALGERQEATIREIGLDIMGERGTGYNATVKAVQKVLRRLYEAGAISRDERGGTVVWGLAT